MLQGASMLSACSRSHPSHMKFVQSGSFGVGQVLAFQKEEDEKRCRAEAAERAAREIERQMERERQRLDPGGLVHTLSAMPERCQCCRAPCVWCVWRRDTRFIQRTYLAMPGTTHGGGAGAPGRGGAAASPGWCWHGSGGLGPAGRSDT